jgi:hypothetical protein
VREQRGALLQKLPHGRIAFQPDRSAVGLQCEVDVAAAREQVGARGPVRLIVGEAGVARQRVERGQAGRRTAGDPLSAHSASYSCSIALQSARR